MKHEIELSREELDKKLKNINPVDITICDREFKPGDIVKYSCPKDDGSKETHVFEITAIEKVELACQQYLGCAD